jgi:hypothetical protein
VYLTQDEKSVIVAETFAARLSSINIKTGKAKKKSYSEIVLMLNCLLLCLFLFGSFFFSG